MSQPYNFDPQTGKPVAKAQAEPPRAADKPKRTFTAKEKTLAWISAFIGYLFCRTFWVWQKPAVGIVFTLCLFAFAFVFFGKKKRKARSFFYPASSLAFSCGLFFSASPVLLFFTFAYICVAFLTFCQTGSEAALEDRAGQLYVFETVKALFVSPFKSFGAAVGAAGENKGGKKLVRTLLIILAGIGVAAIPTAIVSALLSFDAGFTGIIDKIRLTVFDRITEHLFSLILGLPIGMYVYGALYTSAHPAPDSLSREKCIEAENKMKFAPALVGAVAIAPLLFLYCVFIIAQRSYYAAIFTATLPDAYTFAEFARDGFFRLCAVAAVNALALIALRVFTKKTQSGKISPVVKIYTVVLSVVTIVISGTAISQMIMYVSVYGLTRLRLYTLWFMALLILFFLLAALKQFIEKIPFAATALTLFVVCFGCLAVPDTDAFIARHNYNCLLEGTSYKLDAGYLGELAPSSVPVLCEIAQNENLTEETRTAALAEIGRYALNDKRPFCLPGVLAQKAYKKLDRETQLRAVAAYGGLYPSIYASKEEQYFWSGDVYYSMTVCKYDKNDNAVFTENSMYQPLKSRDQIDAALSRTEKYRTACRNEGVESVLPFTANEISKGEGFYIDCFYNDKDRPELYLYNTEKACLIILYIA
ncbi:MAG: DUF4173 domain-containing protein [Clostridia bacterium]|nr:DUF4173 domain-containing protein [Clostridia bacterium]